MQSGYSTKELARQLKIDPFGKCQWWENSSFRKICKIIKQCSSKNDREPDRVNKASVAFCVNNLAAVSLYKPAQRTFFQAGSFYRFHSKYSTCSLLKNSQMKKCVAYRVVKKMKIKLLDKKLFLVSEKDLVELWFM
jgi:hypothetical protein